MNCEICGSRMRILRFTNPKNIQVPTLTSYVCDCCGWSYMSENRHEKAVRLGIKSKSYDNNTQNHYGY